MVIKMTACKVSIIVPVYNTSKYLKNCIDSLLAQTLNEIEIIAVNDGSTDKSFEILKEYQALNPNKVYVYNTENKGVSHARNFGVTKSSGQYLWFVDSDDCVEPNACEELYNKATKDNNDLVLFSRYDVNVETHEKIGNLTFHYNQNFKVSEKPYELLKLSPFPWNKFIKKELFDGVEFPDKIRFEDLPISFILATKAKSIGVINDFFYNYSVQVGFLSKFTESTLDIAKAIDFLINNLKERDCFDLYKNEIEYITVRHFFYRFEQLLTVYGEESFELKVKLINTLFDYLEENFPDFKKNKYIEYNLPDRLNKLFSFYSSREALLDFVARCKDMSEEEQKAYVQKLTSENEVPKAFEFKTFDKIKEETKSSDEKYNKLRKELPIKKEILYISAQEHAVPSSILAMIKYIKAEKNDYEQLIVVNGGNVKESEERLKRYNLGDIQIITRDDEKYLKSLSEAEYIFSDCALEYYFSAKDNQKYFNLQTDNISVKMSRKRERECFEFATAQKSIITPKASIYLTNESRLSFEKAYRCEALPTSAIISDSPAFDMAGATSFAAKSDKIKILFTPQFKATSKRGAVIAYRKFMANLMVIDNELSKKYELFVCLDTFPYTPDFSVFNHIKKMPNEYDLYDFASTCDCVISDYNTILNVFKNTDLKLARFILDANRFISDEELGLDESVPVFTTANELCEFIRTLKKSTVDFTKHENAKELFEKIEKNEIDKKKVEQEICLYYLGGNLTENRVKTFKRIRKEQSFKTFYLCFDEEKNPNYKSDGEEYLKGVRLIPMRFDGVDLFDESDIKGAYLKSKLGLNPTKKFEALCEEERSRYFGDIRFDDEYVLSASQITRNLLFIGLAKHLNYEFNWFDKDKYASKKPFKTKVDYICSRLEKGAKVKINDDMKGLKCVKKLDIE